MTTTETVRTHPRYSRLIVSQDEFHFGVGVPYDSKVLVFACQMMDAEVERVTGHLSRNRQWSWMDRRFWYSDDS